MKKWLRRLLILSAIVALIVAGLYEMATHVGRGWLRGEAFYQDRPTSYWRQRIDVWLELFNSTEDAAQMIPSFIVGDGEDPLVMYGNGIPMRARPVTMWTRCRDFFRSDEPGQRDWDPPAVLLGGEYAEPVLLELRGDERIAPVVRRGLRNIRIQRKLDAETKNAGGGS
jgi:hypothetical protein